MVRTHGDFLYADPHHLVFLQESVTHLYLFLRAGADFEGERLRIGLIVVLRCTEQSVSGGTPDPHRALVID